MSSPYPNQGVYIGGNAQGNVASASHNSTVSQRYSANAAPGDDGLAARLDQLTELIRANQAAIEDWEYALDDLDDIRAIVGQARPDRSRLRDALARLGSRVAAAVPVASAVADLAAKITNLLK